MKAKAKTGDVHAASVRRGGRNVGGAAAGGFWEFVCRDKHGNIKWRETIKNLVVNQGLDDLLSVTLAGGTQDTTWFVGLTDGTPTAAAGDTLASHAGWVEVTDYSGTRKAFVPGAVSGQSVSNTASKASFTFTGDGVVVGGAFLCGVTSGTAGRLYSVGAFTGGDKTLDTDDVLEVATTLTTAAA